MANLLSGDVFVLAILDIFVRNWALISIVVTLVLLAGLPAVILHKYVKIIVKIFHDAPVPLAMDSRDYRRTDSDPVEFRAFDGHRLCGVFHPANPERPLRGTLIFAHELNSDMHSATRYCSALLDAGYEVFAFDFRGQGRSAAEDGHKSRLWPSDRELSDMLGAIAYVEDCLENRGRPRDVGLVGVSRGAGAAILAAVDLTSVKAIMVDGCFSTDAYLEYLMQRWVGIFAKVRLVYENHRPSFWRFLRWLSVRKASRNLGCRFPSVRKAVPRLGNLPMLIIHGEKDGHIPVAQARLIYDLASGPKYLWVCPRAKHNQAVVVQPKLYGQYSVRFFDEHLAGVVTESSDADGLVGPLPQPLSQPTRMSYAKYTKPQRHKRKASSGTPGRR